MRRTCIPLSLAALTLFGYSGCSDPEITSYRAPKDPTPVPPSAANNMQGQLPDTGPAPALKWSTPTGWEEQAGNAVRVVSFIVKAEDGRSAECTVTQFPGDVGGDLANVNRWRQQIQLPPIGQAELDASQQHLHLPNGHFDQVDYTSSTPILEGKYFDRIVGAWVKHPERTWFFKFRGEAKLVGDNLAQFDALLRSISFGAEPAHDQGHDHAHGHDHGPAATPTPTPVAMSTNQGGTDMKFSPELALPEGIGEGLAWTAPEDWPTKPLGPMRQGSYRVPGENGADGDLSIIVLPGAAGGLVENVNRWRGQVQLAPMTDAEAKGLERHVSNSGIPFVVVDLVDPSGVNGILGAIVERGDRSYYFKLTGPRATLQAAKPGFLSLLESVKLR